MLQAERFKATIDPPKGNEIGEMEPDNQVNNLSHNIQELLTLLKNKEEDVNMDTDDDFFHITCHIEPALRAKIAKGEFVDLERLLPKSKLQIMSGTGAEGEIEVVRRNGSTYIFPETGNKDAKINNVRRWEQAFRVYSAIYSEANPTRAAEIWQYVHVINTAATSYAWENVAFYDVTFRQLMDKKPHRSWAKIYTQMWNLSLTDKVRSNFNGGGYQGSAGFQSSFQSGNTGNQKYGDWRDKCCWRFNKGKCRRFGCRFEHRCTVKDCGAYSHPSYQCPKKRRGGGAAGPYPSTTSSVGSGNKGGSKPHSESKVI